MIVVTGASGHFGRLVVQGLLEKVPAERIVAAVRTPEKASDLAERGVIVRKADFNEPATLASAFDGAEKVLLVSGNEFGRRIPQHQAVIEAAQKAGVSHLVYTSAPKADTSAVVLVPDHKVTEELIRSSGLTYTILRNGWYNENFQPSIEQAVRTGGFIGSAGDGRVATAGRADLAAGAVAVLTGEGHENKIYELDGEVAWTYADLAAEIGKVTGKEVVYTDLPAEQHRAALTAAGLPDQFVEMVVGLDANTKDGLLSDTSGQLRALIGRAPTPIATTIGEIVKGT
jgi:NAD(P)H dehydrogenase (quinone)